MAVRYWIGGTGTWDQSTTAHWATSSGGSGGAAVPTSADDVIFDANSGIGTITLGAATPCQSLSSAGTTLGTFTSAGFALTIGGVNPGAGNVALDASGFATWTNATNTTFASTSTTVQTVKTGGHSLGTVAFTGVNGNWSLQDNLTCTGQIQVGSGTLTTNSVNLACTNFITNSSTFAKLYLNTSTITVSAGTNAVLLNGQPYIIADGCTWVLTGASPTINNSTASNARFNLGTVNFTGTGTLKLGTTYPITLKGITCAGGRSLQFIHGTTTTITSATSWNVNGSAGNLVTLQSDTGAAWDLCIGPGKVQSDYLAISNCTAFGGARFWAGAHSTDGGGNSGWVFRAKAKIVYGGPRRRINGSPTLPPVVTFPVNTSTYGFPVPYIGASCDNQSFDISYPQRTQDNITIFEDSIRTRCNGMLFFNNFYDALPSPLAGNPNRLVKAGKLPMLTFIPATSAGTYDLAGIIAGNYDSMIQNWASYMNGNAIVRFAHEMNISSIWGNSYGSANYVALWRHVRSVWQAKETALGYSHCPWFWCANAGTAFDAFYPGDAYCEIIGFDGYSESPSSYPSPAAVYTPASYGLADLEGLSTLPIIIGEIGAGGQHPDRATWFSQLFTLLSTHPQVKGFNYWWHESETPFDHYKFTLAEGDRNDDPAVAAAFQAAIATWAAGVS